MPAVDIGEIENARCHKRQRAFFFEGTCRWYSVRAYPLSPGDRTLVMRGRRHRWLVRRWRCRWFVPAAVAIAAVAIPMISVARMVIGNIGLQAGLQRRSATTVESCGQITAHIGSGQ